MSYTSLHNHTDYSNIRMLDSINQLPLVFERAKELKLNGVAITDHETLSGHIKAIQLLKSLREKAKTEEDKKYWNNFKLILGNEIYLTRNNLITMIDRILKNEKEYDEIKNNLKDLGIKDSSSRIYEVLKDLIMDDKKFY